MKSVSYPMFELSTIVDILGKARKAGKTINKQLLADIASGSQNSSTKSGIFNQRIAAFKHYGLADVERNLITFTPLSDLVVLNEKAALRKAFLAPETFSKLYSTIEKNIYLEKELLENIALLQIGISESGKENFVGNFINSGIYAGLVSYSVGSDRQVLIKDFEDTPIDEKDGGSNTINKQKAELNISQGKAIIIVPDKLSTEDKNKLKAQIELF